MNVRLKIILVYSLDLYLDPEKVSPYSKTTKE